MSTQRKTQDIYPMVVSNAPLQDNYSMGDTIRVHHRVERLERHGWISEYEQEDGVYVATLTQSGAAVLNYFGDAMRNNQLGRVLKGGAGKFVDDALQKYGVTDAWHIVSMDDDSITIENASGDRKSYSKRQKDL